MKKVRLRQGRFGRLAVVGMIGTLVIAACGVVEPTPSSSASWSQPGAKDRVIVGAGGASVSIPGGATEDDREVHVSALTTPEGLPPTGDPGAFAGGVQLEPHGLTFTSPVTVTIPLIQRQTPGRELRLYHWDGSGDAWEETDFLARVAEDGWSASGDVTHFSYYVLQPSQIGAEADGIFGDIEGVVSSLTRGGSDLASVTQAVFGEVVGHVNARFPLGVPRPFDVPIPNGYNCYAPVGHYFEFNHGGAPGVPRPLVVTTGDIDDVEFRIDYFREIDVTIKVGNLENELTGLFTVHVYWRSRPPVLELTADKSAVWAGDTAHLTAELRCGDMGMTNQEIEFSLPPGDTIGILSPETDTTDRDGQAVTALQTDEEAGDDALVEGWYQWTNQSGDVTVAVSDAVRVRLGTITGNWSITGTETWSLCTDPADNGTFSGSGEVRFAQLDDTVTGHGWISPEDDLISEDDFIVGTIQRIGERGFEVTGTSTYREEYLVCEDGGCENWIVNGFTEFRGTGSIDSDTIRFTWHGRDLSGDTCVSEGEGQTTYVGR